jgi:release factor glutamine methyltransferase
VSSVADALARARALGIDRLDAQLLLGHQIGQSRSWLIAHGDDALAPADELAYLQLLQRRADGEPLAYLVGEREFHGLMLTVTPAVLVPRPDTECLVDWALDLMAEQATPRVLDLGTGSGAIALALAHRQPAASLTATDCSAEALAVARANAARHGLQVHFHHADWWDGVGGPAFDLVVSNPPYIAGEDPHLGALRHEPQLALTPGGDGLGALRRIVAGAPAHLRPGGWLLLEHGYDQGAAVRQLLHGAGFEALQTRTDLAGVDRCTGGRLPGENPR